MADSQLDFLSLPTSFLRPQSLVSDGPLTFIITSKPKVFPKRDSGVFLVTSPTSKFSACSTEETDVRWHMLLQYSLNTALLYRFNKRDLTVPGVLRYTGHL